ncbi:MAG: hypothetical protein CM15mP127_08350 [Gammaproteobacteria bacterium]|nr:MAG: hypothetical protein CM15mP127_08350 [Gammaproteobacteria bacterium]
MSAPFNGVTGRIRSNGDEVASKNSKNPKIKIAEKIIISSKTHDHFLYGL